MYKCCCFSSWCLSKGRRHDEDQREPGDGTLNLTSRIASFSVEIAAFTATISALICSMVIAEGLLSFIGWYQSGDSGGAGGRFFCASGSTRCSGAFLFFVFAAPTPLSVSESKFSSVVGDVEVLVAESEEDVFATTAVVVEGDGCVWPVIRFGSVMLCKVGVVLEEVPEDAPEEVAVPEMGPSLPAFDFSGALDG